MELCVVSRMTQPTLRRMMLISAMAIALAACGTMNDTLSPPPAVSPPTPMSKPASVMPAELSQKDAETACLLQGSRKFAVELSDVQVTESTPVDAGFLVSLKIGGAARTCIIAKDGFVRSLR